MPLRFGKKKGKKPAKLLRSRAATRAQGTRVLAQGAGQVAIRALGGERIPRSPSLACWNAHAAAHAGLPRAVGPYSVVKTTTMITSKSPFLMFGSFALSPKMEGAPTALKLGEGGGSRQWTNVCAIGAPDELSAGAFANNNLGQFHSTSIHTIPIPGATGNGVFAKDVDTGQTPTFSTKESNITAVPSAISVQIINPTAVQAASGSAVAAVCPVRLDLQDSTKAWGDIGNELLSYYHPRVLTGGKLALRGVQMDSLPLSMTDVSDFREIWEVDPLIASPSKLKWSSSPAHQSISNAPALTSFEATFPVGLHPEGWAPLVYYSPSAAAQAPSDRQDMTFLVTFEWRTRFDISNPACSSHAMHPPSTDIDWHRMIKKASDALPGVLDIVEKVANTGLKVYSAMPK